MKYRAVIFDLDGTLLDTIPDILVSVNAMLQEFEYPELLKEQLIGMIGDGARKMIARAIPNFAAKYDSIVDRCLNRYNEIYFKTNQKTRPFDGILPLLDQLQDKKIQLCVLSNKPHRDAVKVVAEKIPYTFAMVLGASDEYPPKPNTKGLTHMLQVLDLKINDCLYIGDGEMDFLTPNALQMPCVSALWGYRSKEQLQTVGATAFVNHPLDLLSLLS